MTVRDSETQSGPTDVPGHKVNEIYRGGGGKFM